MQTVKLAKKKKITGERINFSFGMNQETLMKACHYDADIDK